MPQHPNMHVPLSCSVDVNGFLKKNSDALVGAITARAGTNCSYRAKSGDQTFAARRRLLQAADDNAAVYSLPIADVQKKAGLTVSDQANQLAALINDDSIGFAVRLADQCHAC